MEIHVTGVTPWSTVCHPGPDRHGLGRGGFLPHEVGSRAQGHGCPGDDAWLVSHSGVWGRAFSAPEYSRVRSWEGLGSRERSGRAEPSRCSVPSSASPDWAAGAWRS